MAHYLKYEDGTLVSLGDQDLTQNRHEMRLDVREVLGTMGDVAIDIGSKLATIGLSLRNEVGKGLDEVTLEMGFDLQGESGMPVIARIDAGVYIHVTATWRFGSDPA